MYTSPRASQSSGADPWLDVLGALETLTRKISEPDPFTCIFVGPDGACELSEFIVFSGLKGFGEVFGLELVKMSGELRSCDALTELSFGLFDVKSLLSYK